MCRCARIAVLCVLIAGVAELSVTDTNRAEAQEVLVGQPTIEWHAPSVYNYRTSYTTWHWNATLGWHPHLHHIDVRHPIPGHFFVRPSSNQSVVVYRSW